MKQQKKLDACDINISEIRCLKNKALEKCHTKKCYIFNWYHNQELPCPYYIPPNNERGFSENLDEINGAAYNIDFPSRGRMGLSSVRIVYNRDSVFVIPYAPRSILKIIKMYCPNIKAGLNAGSKVIVGLFIGMPILMPLLILLIKGHLK